MENLLIEIPEDVISHLRLPPRNLKQELKKELAVHLYAEGLLPQASACRLAGLSVLFHNGKPYFKLLKHVDVHLPIDWFFWLAEILGLYHPIWIAGVGETPFSVQFRAVALGTLIYLVMGYMLGFFLLLSGNPHRSREVDTANTDTEEQCSGCM